MQNQKYLPHLCTELAFCVKIITEMKREFNLEIHLAYIDYEKASDKVKRHSLFSILQERNIPNDSLQIINMHKNNTIIKKTE
jgi:predicted hydrolase (HD superfamily)